MIATYVLISRGRPGEEAEPLIATSDPVVVQEVMDVLARSFFDSRPDIVGFDESAEPRN